MEEHTPSVRRNTLSGLDRWDFFQPYVVAIEYTGAQRQLRVGQSPFGDGSLIKSGIDEDQEHAKFQLITERRRNLTIPVDKRVPMLALVFVPPEAPMVVFNRSAQEVL